MKTIVMTLLIAAALLVAAATTYVFSGIYDAGASTPHSALSRWFLHTAMRSSVARRAVGITVPELDDQSLVLAGASDFEEMCVPCHGAPGKDPAAVGQGLNPPAPDLVESAREMSAAELFWVTKHGVRMTGMPAWGRTHTDDSLWPVVALMSVLPELDAETYEELVSRADGMGHHATDSTDGHAHERDNRQDGQEFRDDTDGPEESEEPEHDHSTHEH